MFHLLVVISLLVIFSCSEASVLPYQNEHQVDKWLMMYLQTHPQYEDQTIGQEVFMKWKLLLLETFEVSSYTPYYII